MTKYENCRVLANETAEQINIENIWKDLETLSHLERYTGSEEGEKADNLICSRM